MKRRTIMIVVLASVSVLTLFTVATYLYRKNSKIGIANQLLSVIFTAPNAELEKSLIPGQPDLLDDAVFKLVGDWVDKQALDDISGTIWNYAIGLQTQSVFQNFKITPEKIVVTPVQSEENHYFYTVSATITRKNGDPMQVEFNGSLQFGDSGKINYMTIRGDGMKEAARIVE